MKSDIRFMLNVLKTAWNVARSRTFPLAKSMVLRSYIRLKTKQWLLNRFNRVPSPPEDVLGVKMDYTHFNTLCYLFDEMVIRQQYCFACDRPDPLIIDCGSTIGMSIVYFKTLYPQSRIVAFEPFEEAYEKLYKNVRSNKLENVDLHKKAVHGREGTIDFFYNPVHVGSLRMSTSRHRLEVETAHVGHREVESVLLSSYIQEPVDLLKMDIEGAELCVMRELADRDKLSMIGELIGRGTGGDWSAGPWEPFRQPL